MLFTYLFYFLKKRVNERKIVRQAKETAQKELMVSVYVSAS